MNTNKDQQEQGLQGDKQTKNGVVTVNDDNNPTQEQRDEMIGKEPDTDRLRSERESVQQSNTQQGS